MARRNRPDALWAAALILAMCAGTSSQVRAETATPSEMEVVCRNWLSYMVNQQGHWGGATDPKIVGVDEIVADDQVVARCFSIAPRGHVVVPVLQELPPVKAYSDECSLNVSARGGLLQILRDVLSSRSELYIDVYGSLEASQPDSGKVLLGREHREQWDRFLAPPEQFKAELPIGGDPAYRSTSYLLSTHWHQGYPFNRYCPSGDTDCGSGDCPGGKDPDDYATKVGCTATAVAQIMKYHEWPKCGVGWLVTDDWEGDSSCGAAGPPYPDAQTLYRDVSDAYEWVDMPNDCSSGCTDGQAHALGELCAEVGLALKTDYGVCGSSANLWEAQAALPEYFAYQDTIEKLDRDDYATASAWFAVIEAEIDAGRPMAYHIKDHQIVCDGAQEAGGLKQYHMNYGWGNNNCDDPPHPCTDWYTIDELYCPWEPDDVCPPLEEYLLRYIQPGPAVWIDAHPATQIVCEPDPVTFSVDANGVGTLSYQWRRYSVDIEGATSDSYTISSTLPTDAGGYSVVVTSTCEPSEAPAIINDVTSNTATLTVNTPVSITQDPQNAEACEGGQVTFTIGLAGSSPFTYQWYHNGQEIIGATNNVYTVNPVTTADAGTYDVVVNNDCNEVTSAPATLTVNTDPTITQQPQSQTVCEGDSVTFSVDATGTPAPSYQWYHNNNPVGPDDSSYTIDSVSPSHAGSYKVEVTNECGSVTSNTAGLAVDTLTITQHPQSQSKCEGESVTFTAAATGTLPLSYQWRKDGILTGATGTSYTIDPVLPTHAGTYDVVVSGDVCVATSNPAELTVTTPVTITEHPQSQEICEGEPVTFTVTATGAPDLSYQWRVGGVDILGATADSYTIPAVALDNAGEYDVVVSDGPCSTTSDTAILTVATPATIVPGGHPEDNTVCEGDSVTFEVDATGTPPPTYRWFHNDNLIPDAQDASYTIEPVTLDDAGVYFVVVSNVCNSVDVVSDPAVLSVQPLTITLPDNNYPDIQSAIDGVCETGGTVILGDGTYDGPGNRDLNYGTKEITVRSQSGNPEDCIINCGGTPADPHRGFFFYTCEVQQVLEGVTIKNGYDLWQGGGIYCVEGCPLIRNCIFLDNKVGRLDPDPPDEAGSGGGFAGRGCGATLENCIFSGNLAGSTVDGGGGVSCKECTPESGCTLFLLGCTFDGNLAPNGTDWLPSNPPGSGGGGGLYAGGVSTDEACEVEL